MKSLVQTGFTLAVLAASFISSSVEGACLPPRTDLRTIVPDEWVTPGDYKLWNTNCAHYVFNYSDRLEDMTFYNPTTTRFFNYGFATNTITELDVDDNNGTVAAQINSWSMVKSGVHKLFGAAIQTINTPEGDARTTIVATESQVNSRNSENASPKMGIDTVLYTAGGSDDPEIGSDRYNVNSRANPHIAQVSLDFTGLFNNFNIM